MIDDLREALAKATPEEAAQAFWAYSHGMIAGQAADASYFAEQVHIKNIAALIDALKAEKAAIVAWLREIATDPGSTNFRRQQALNEAADAIERGDHIKEAS